MYIQLHIYTWITGREAGKWLDSRISHHLNYQENNPEVLGAGERGEGEEGSSDMAGRWVVMPFLLQ